MNSPPNRVYYMEIAPGSWTGRFTFRLTDFRRFFKESMSVKDKFLVLCMWLFQRVFGDSSISSVIVAHPHEGDAGTCSNDIRIFKAFFPLFHSQETYILSKDGEDVRVEARVAFGPIPFLFRESDVYGAKVSDGGFKNRYQIKLLGTHF